MAAVFVVVGIAVVADLHHDRSRIREAEAARLESLSRYVTENLVRQLGAVNEALDGAGALHQEALLFHGDMRDTQQLALLTRAMPSVQAMTLFDANGVAVAADRPERVGVSYFDAEYFTLPSARPRAHTLYLTRPAVAGSTVAMHVSRPILNAENRFAGVASATLNEDFFGLVVRSALFAPDMRVTLAHSDGELFLSFPPVPTDRVINVATPGSAFSRHVQSGQPTTVYEGLIAITGLNRLVVFSTVNPQALGMNKPIVFAVSRSMDAIYGPWVARAWRYLLLYFVAMALAAAAVVWETRRQVRVAGVKRRVKEEMAASAARLERALDGADLGLWELQLDTRQMQVDARGASMLGYGSEPLGKTVDGWNGTLHPSDVEGNARAFAPQKVTHRLRKLRMREPVGRPRLHRQQSARHLVLALRTAFKPLVAVGDTPRQRHVVTSVEVQAGNVLGRAPVAAKRDPALRIDPDQ